MLGHIMTQSKPFSDPLVGLSQPHQHATNITRAQHNLRCKSKNLCEAFYK